MKTLYICRHAKSSWADAGQRDHDRPLNERGERNAAFMSAHFKERGEFADLLVSSTAVRAASTAKAFGKALAIPPSSVVYVDTLYHAAPGVILQVINQLPDTAQRVLLFGHNPGFSEIVDLLCDEHVGVLPTCGIVRLDLPVETWAMASAGIATLVWEDHPKRHPGQH